MKTMLRPQSDAPLHRPMSRFIRALFAALIVLGGFVSTDAGAVGVQAGTQIQNQASATYDISGTPFVATSGTHIVTVDEVVDVQVTLQSPPVPVTSPDTNQVLSFLVTNTGNVTFPSAHRWRTWMRSSTQRNHSLRANPGPMQSLRQTAED